MNKILSIVDVLELLEKNFNSDEMCGDKTDPFFQGRKSAFEEAARVCRTMKLVCKSNLNSEERKELV